MLMRYLAGMPLWALLRMFEGINMVWQRSCDLEPELYTLCSLLNYPSFARSPYPRFILHVWAVISCPLPSLLPVTYSHNFLPLWHV